MLDIHLTWLLVLLANFLILIFLLNKILFQPLLKIFHEREETVKGSLAAAEEMQKKKEDGIERMNRELAAARKQAKDAFEDLRNQGLEMQRSSLSQADAHAAELLQKAREEIGRESEKARQQLKADVEKFSDEIVRKLVKA